MNPYLLEQNNEDSIFGAYKRLYYSPRINYQDMSERDLNNSLFNDDDQSILNIFNENKYDNDESRILVINEKISTGDITKFKTNLKENIPILYSFDDIKQKIFKNELYEKKFQFDFNNIIKKIKVQIFKYLTKFLNNIINDKEAPKENNEILKISYCFINQIKREIDLKYLNMHLMII